MESVAGLNRDFWRNRRVFLTGHTGFKGAWLSLWLADMGAKVTGYALPPPTVPSLFELCSAGQSLQSILGDVRDRNKLFSAMREAAPDLVIHMAAQPLVLESYRNPAETYEINVMGTVNVLEAVRNCRGIRAVVNVTTDKCYENREWDWGYRENDPLGGHDPYSNSKACSEIITAAYRQAFFEVPAEDERAVAVATARAGNVIGGGDWAADRLLADCMRSILRGEPVRVRNPRSIRPWQHVLEPLAGYLTLAERLHEHGSPFVGSWNFGPSENENYSVEWVVGTLCELWGNGACYEPAVEAAPVRETRTLRLDCSRARRHLEWKPRWTTRQALEKTAEWMRAYQQGLNLRETTLNQILEYEQQAGGKNE